MVDSVAINDKFALDMKMGPMFQTTVIDLAGGYEDRNQDWVYALWRYDVELKNRPLAEIRAFMAHLLGRRGAANTFPLRDPIDNTLTDEDIGTGDGAETEFQIIKTYADTDRPYLRPITLVSGLVVKKNSVVQTLTTHYTESAGLITFVSPPANGHLIEVTCDFLIRVRYEEDYNPILLPVGPDLASAYASTGLITLMEVLR